MRNDWIVKVLAPAAGVLLLGAVSGAAQAHSAERQAVLDRIVADRVAVRLARSASLAGTDISVKSEDNVVTLEGAVGSETDKTRALRIARHTPGVHEVTDAMEIDPSLETERPEVGDEELVKRAAQAIAEAFPDARIEEDWFFGRDVEDDLWEFEVEADDGTIMLTGTISAPGDARKAVSAVRDVPGVRSVETHLRIDPRSAYAFTRGTGYGPRYDYTARGPRAPYASPYADPYTVAYPSPGTIDLAEAPEVSAFNADEAVAVLHPTRGNEAQGTVRFEETDEGVRVTTKMRGLAPGTHGYHVHLYGDCTAPDATSAGTHFNFLGPSKDLPEDVDRITGNLGELVSGEQGNATAGRVVPEATLEGPFSIVGHAVVVHAKANDPDSPPIGAAGSRVACGVIGFAG